MGTYAKLLPTESTKRQIEKITNLINIQNRVSMNSLHVTVIYSRVKCESVRGIDPHLPIIGHGTKFEIFKNQDGSDSLVLLIASNQMQALHIMCVEDHDATHDYENYQPHLTLSYNYDAPIPHIDCAEHFSHLEFDQFVVEPLDFNWLSQ